MKGGNRLKKVSANQNENDFSAVVQSYSNMLLKYAYTFCRNQEDAEDVVQDVFLKYLSKGQSFESEEHRKAWLLRTTINTAKNYKNTFWNRNRTSLGEEYIFENSIEEEIWDVVNKLPDKYRIIVDLYYRDGYSIKEIAFILGKKTATVGTQLNRARQKLREMLKEE